MELLRDNGEDVEARHPEASSHEVGTQEIDSKRYGAVCSGKQLVVPLCWRGRSACGLGRRVCCSWVWVWRSGKVGNGTWDKMSIGGPGCG
jgi:hypothetical protein